MHKKTNIKISQENKPERKSYIKDYGSIIISVFALGLSGISAYLFYQQQSELVELRIENEKQRQITLKIDAHQKLDKAVDLMGGRIGTETITTFGSSDNLVMAERLIRDAILLLPTFTKARNILGTYFYGKKKLPESYRKLPVFH